MVDAVRNSPTGAGGSTRVGRRRYDTRHDLGHLLHRGFAAARPDLFAWFVHRPGAGGPVLCAAWSWKPATCATSSP
jgi:hypothetical protein